MRVDKIEGETVLQRNEEVIWDRIDGATVLCHTGTVEFYRLNNTGAAIWDLCDGRTMEEVIAALCAQYPSAEGERMAALVRDYTPLLAKEGLLEISHANTSKA